MEEISSSTAAGKKAHKAEIWTTSSFSAPPAEMLLGEMAAIFGINPSSIKTTTLRLPSTKKGPLSSSWLIRDDSSVEEASGLSPCYTDDLAFTPSPSNLRIICPSSHLWLGFGAEDMEFDLHVPKVEAEGQNSKIMIRSFQRRFNFARGLS